MNQELVQKQNLPDGWKIYTYKICTLRQPEKKLKKFKVTEYKKSGKYPIIDQGKDFIAGYTDEEEIINLNQPVIVFGDHTLSIKYIDFPFARGADGTQIIIPNQKIVIPKFFYYFLRSLNIQVKNYERYFKYVKKRRFIVPPLPVQQQIVAKLDAQMAQIEIMKKEAENVKEKVNVLLSSYLSDINEKYAEKIGTFEEYIEDTQNGYGRRPSLNEGGVIVLRIADVSSGTIDYSNVRRGREDKNIIEKYHLKNNDLIFIRVNGSKYFIGKCILFKEELNEFVLYNDHLIKVVVKKHLVLPEFASIWCESPIVRMHMASKASTSAGQLTINRYVLNTIPFPNISILEQEKIIQQYERIKRIFANNNTEAERQLTAISQLPSSILNEVFGKYDLSEVENEN